MAERYSAEQVQQILVAAMGQMDQEGFSRSQLMEMAHDLGISPDALQKAQEMPSTMPAQPTVQPNRQRIQPQLRTYAVVNAFLLALNFILSGTITWAIYPLLGWGLGLLLPPQISPCSKRDVV